MESDFGIWRKVARSRSSIVSEIPKSTSATVDARIVNGLIAVRGLDLSRLTVSNRSISGRLGSGDGTITLRVVNGNLSLIGK